MSFAYGGDPPGLSGAPWGAPGSLPYDGDVPAMPGVWLYSGDDSDTAAVFHYGDGAIGIAGSLVPATGEHGPGYIYNDLSLPADAAKEYRGTVISPPGAGAFAPGEPSGFTLTGAPDGTYVFTYRLWEDGADRGTGTATIVIGAAVYNGAATAGSLARTSDTVAGTYTPPGGAGSYNGVVQPSVLALASDSVAGGYSPPGGYTGAVASSVIAITEATIAGSYLPPGGIVLKPGRRVLKAGRKVPQKLPPLDVAEVDDLTVDLSTVLGADDTVVEVTLTAEARVGSDPVPEPLWEGPAIVSGRYVMRRMRGASGLLGVTYLIRCVARGGSGHVALAAGFIKVVRQA